MVQRQYYHQCMGECGYEESHDDSEKDYKDASFKIQQIKAKQLTLEEGEELSQGDKDELALQRTFCVEAVGHMRTCANNHKSAYMKASGLAST